MSDIVKGKKPGGCPPPPPPRPPRHRPPKDMPFPPPPPPPPVFPGPCCPPTSTLVLNNTVVESDDGSITVKAGYYKGRPAYFLSINSDLVKPNLAGAPPIRIEEEEIDGKPYQVVYVDPTIGSGSEPCIPSKPTAEDLDKFLRGDGQWSAITIPEQVQANWTEEDSGEPSFIQNKPGNFQGATANDNGTSGFVPAPTTADKDKFLCGNGQWSEVDNTRECTSLEMDGWLDAVDNEGNNNG